MRTNRGYLFRACSSKGVSHCHLCLAETRRQAGECEALCGKYKWKRRLQVCSALMEVVGIREVGAG